MASAAYRSAFRRAHADQHRERREHACERVVARAQQQRFPRWQRDENRTAEDADRPEPAPSDFRGGEDGDQREEERHRAPDPQFKEGASYRNEPRGERVVEARLLRFVVPENVGLKSPGVNGWIDDDVPPASRNDDRPDPRCPAMAGIAAG